MRKIILKQKFEVIAWRSIDSSQDNENIIIKNKIMFSNRIVINVLFNKTHGKVVIEILDNIEKIEIFNHLDKYIDKPISLIE